MMRIIRQPAAVVLLLAAASFPLSRANAQPPVTTPGDSGSAAAADSLPFRAGQWGAEFAIAGGAVGLGALRFVSERTAWVIDASIAVDWSESESSATIFDDEARRYGVGLRTGPRRYRAVGADAAAYVGAGVTTAYSRTRSGASGYRAEAWDAGVFGELGAVYFVTSHLSLGGQASLAATYGETEVRYPELGDHSWNRRARVALSPVRILGALYL